MKITRQDYEFSNPLICHVYPRTLEFDRVMINLYLLLKYEGRRPVAKRQRSEVKIETIVKNLIEQHGDSLEGFADYAHVVEDWVYSDLVDIVYRGVADKQKEKVTAPIPLHLNAYKLRNPTYVKDYRCSEHLYSMIYHADDSDLIKNLSDFLGRGMTGGGYETYDRRVALDMYTLMIVRMVDVPGLEERPSSETHRPEPPLCMGQARLMCDDIRRLLAYEHVLPRPVLIGYLRTALGFHLGLYLLRLFNQLAAWVVNEAAHPICLNCPVYADMAQPFTRCPFAFQNSDADEGFRMPELLIDMGDDFTSHMAQLAQENCARHYAQINDYIRAVFTVNQLFRFAQSSRGRRLFAPPPQTAAEVLTLLSNPSETLENFFADRIDEILPLDEEKDETEGVLAIRQMQGLSSFERFIELVALERTKYYRKYLTEQLDSAFMKNRDTALLQQGKGKRNRRRWYLGSRLLEMLAQIALLEPDNGGGFRSRSMLIDDYVVWLRERYGLVLMPNRTDATIQDYAAFNENLRHLKARLREIGFYTDLSDAYNTQRIRPRYIIEPML